MDPRLETLFAQKLSVSTTRVKSAYLEALNEFFADEKLPPENDSGAKGDTEKKTCAYKFICGKNDGKLCGKNAKNDFEEKSYCTAHLKTVKEKKTRSANNKLKDTSLPKKFEIKTIAQKYETEKHNEFLVLKGTLLIVDSDRNCCLGKYEKDELTDKITREEQMKLEELNIPYYMCTVVDSPTIDVDKDLEESEPLSI